MLIFNFSPFLGTFIFSEQIISSNSFSLRKIFAYFLRCLITKILCILKGKYVAIKQNLTFNKIDLMFLEIDCSNLIQQCMCTLNL